MLVAAARPSTATAAPVTEAPEVMEDFSIVVVNLLVLAGKVVEMEIGVTMPSGMVSVGREGWIMIITGCREGENENLNSFNPNRGDGEGRGEKKLTPVTLTGGPTSKVDSSGSQPFFFGRDG